MHGREHRKPSWRNKFVAAFGKRYPNSIAEGALEASVANDFSGAHYEKSGTGRDAKIEVSCSRLTAKLQAMVEELSSGEHLPEGTALDCPMDKNAFKVLHDSQFSHTPLGDIRVLKAQRIGGLGGYIVLCCRPDGYLAYVALTQYLGYGLTQVVWDALLRWAAYLYNTAHLKLTYRASSEGTDWVVYVDSSLFNAQEGRSMGGYCALYPGSGIFAWRCFSPRKLGISSGATESIMGAHAVHYIYGQRILDKDLGLASGRPTTFYTDNLATLQGTKMENVPAEQRYMAARRAVQAVMEEKIVDLQKVTTDDNLADIFTKPLEGPQFEKLRALILGLAVAEDGQSAEETSSLN